MAKEPTKSDAVVIDTASLAEQDKAERESQPSVEIFDAVTLVRLSTEELENRLAQGVYGAREKPLVEAELRRRSEWDQEGQVIAELREQIAGLEDKLRDRDAELRSSGRWIKIFMVLAGVFVAAWFVEIGPSLWEIVRKTILVR